MWESIRLQFCNDILKGWVANLKETHYNCTLLCFNTLYSFHGAFIGTQKEKHMEWGPFYIFTNWVTVHINNITQ